MSSFKLLRSDYLIFLIIPYNASVRNTLIIKNAIEEQPGYPSFAFDVFQVQSHIETFSERFGHWFSKDKFDKYLNESEQLGFKIISLSTMIRWYVPLDLTHAYGPPMSWWIAISAMQRSQSTPWELIFGDPGLLSPKAVPNVGWKSMWCRNDG